MSLTGEYDVRRYTPSEVAKRYKVSRPTVAHWCESGLLPAINLATANATKRRWRISESDLQEFETKRYSRVGVEA